MQDRTRAVVALGMFDGVHIGHQELLETSRALARSMDAVSAVYTFENHPLSVLGGNPRLLSGPAERRELLLQFGADEVEMVPFDWTMAALPPEAFVRMLSARWDVCGVTVGFNYTFGDRGAGTPETLAALGRSAGFFTMVVPPVQAAGEPVSSTRIRSSLEAGDVRGAAALLGRPYALSGKVVPNRQNGRLFGFPTANIQPAADRVLPLDGVYVTEAEIPAGPYRAVTNVGMNPTLHGDRVTVETHLLDFSGDLYGAPLSVRFLSRLRGERRFPSVDALKAQIAADAAAARAYGDGFCK